MLLGSVLELLYLLIFALTPLYSTHPTLSPSGTDWPWILAPAQLLVHKTSNLGYHISLAHSASDWSNNLRIHIVVPTGAF